MSIWENLISGIKDKWENLQKNTFLTSFLIAWCLHNWKVFANLFVINDTNIESQIVAIDKLFSNALSVYWYPLFFATLTTFAYPFLRMIINYLVTKIEFIEKNVSIKQKEDEPLSKEEVKKLKTQLSQHVIEIDNLQSTIKIKDNIIKEMTIEIFDYLLTNNYPIPKFQNMNRPNGHFPSNLSAIDYSILQSVSEDIQILYSKIKSSNRFNDYIKLTQITRKNNPNNDVLSNPGGSSKIYSMEAYKDIDITSIDYFESIGLLEKKQIHKFTKKGMEVYKLHINDV
ncbi:MAG: hypothetical protein J0M05_12845 [Candidatus Kapabacteria bacterium]|nr:hypothetical protein [Candidatus Kapabacteria bacterium]